jgi:hypothetical protein
LAPSPGTATENAAEKIAQKIVESPVAMASAEAVSPAAEPRIAPTTPLQSALGGLADTGPMDAPATEEDADLDWAADLAWAQSVEAPAVAIPVDPPRLPEAIPATAPEIELTGVKTTILGAWKILGSTEPPQSPNYSTAAGSTSATSPTAAAQPAALPLADSPGAARFAAKAAALVKKKAPPTPKFRKKMFSASGRAERVIRAIRRVRLPWSRASAATSPEAASGAKLATVKAATRPRRNVQAEFRRIVYLTATGLAALSLVAMLPALKNWDLGIAPGWARGVLLWSVLQLAYAAWLASVPDWGSLWVAMFVFAATATLYGTVGTVALTMPQELDLPLDLTAVRSTAPYWCAAMALLMLGAAYWCGRVAQRARRFSHPK